MNTGAMGFSEGETRPVMRPILRIQSMRFAASGAGVKRSVSSEATVAPFMVRSPVGAVLSRAYWSAAAWGTKPRLTNTVPPPSSAGVMIQ